jgi:hypothetical protein
MMFAYLFTKLHQGQYLGSYFRGHSLRSPSADRLNTQRFGNPLASVIIYLLNDVPVGLRKNLFPSREGSWKIWGRCGIGWTKYTVWIWCGGLSAWPAWTYDTNPKDFFHVGTPERAPIHSTFPVHPTPYTETPDNCNKGRRQLVKMCSRERPTSISQRHQPWNGRRTFVKQALTTRSLWFRFW